MKSRATLLLAGLAAAGCAAPAPTQEKRLLERVTATPDVRLVNPMQEKQFRGAAGISLREAQGLERQASTRSFRPAPATPTRSFLGIPNPWLGRTNYAAPAARVLNRSSLPLDKSYSTRNFPNRDSRPSPNKEFATPQAIAVRPYAGRGGAQGSLNLISEAARRELTPDELRELLNKPQ